MSLIKKALLLMTLSLLASSNLQAMTPEEGEETSLNRKNHSTPGSNSLTDEEAEVSTNLNDNKTIGDLGAPIIANGKLKDLDRLDLDYGAPALATVTNLITLDLDYGAAALANDNFKNLTKLNLGNNTN